MDKNEKSLKQKLEMIPGVSVRLNISLESKIFKEAFKSVENNLNFFKGCISRVTSSLSNALEVVNNLEEFYCANVNDCHYGSELETLQVIINSELLKIVNINQSTKYKGLPLLDQKADDFIGKEKLLIDIYSEEKYEIDFSQFNLDIYSGLVLEPGLNLGAKNKLAYLSLDYKNTSSSLEAYKYRTGFLNDFGSYKFNLQRMLDKALSISAILESKSVFLNIIKDACVDSDEFKSETKKINFVNLKNHQSEDSKKISEYV